MELYSDTYYIHRIQKGDTACFACLLDKYSHSVFSLIFKVIQNREDAEELTQDVFIKVFKHLSSFNGTCSFSTWLYRIAYNTAISETRKKKRELLPINEDLINNISEKEVEEILGRADNATQVEMLEKALTQLSTEERALVFLFYKEEKTIEEISSISELTKSNVKTKLFRIRKKLFVLLKEMEG
jgi:RNA polymerase sigma-70 factor (ECF subfamily)